MTSLMRSFRTDFGHQALLGGARPALLSDMTSDTVSYAELGKLLARHAPLFARHGVSRDRPVLCLLPNSIEHLVCFLATAWHGVGYAPITPESTPRELDSWIKLVRPGLCLAPPELPEALAEVVSVADIPIVHAAVDNGFAWLDADGGSAVIPGEPAGGYLYLTTSGSTGEPRAMVFETYRLWSSARAFLALHPFVDESARFYNMLPMSYLGGLFNLGIIPLAAGGSVVVAATFSGKSTLSFWQTLVRHDVTVLWLVPTIVRSLLAIGKRIRRTDHGAVAPKVIASFLGTAPIDLGTKQKFETVFGIPLLENFALSETTFLTSEMLHGRARRIEGSVGKPLPYVELRFVPRDPDGEETSGPVPTEVYVRTPFMILGYLQADGSISLPQDENGFFPTGDLAHIDPSSSLAVLDGRRRYIIKRGGLFIALREIEVLAEHHPAIAEAVAVGVKHSFYGETVALYLRLNEPAGAADAVVDFTAWLHANLVRYKWPDSIEVVEDFPRTPSGKVRKHLVGANPEGFHA